MVREIGPEDVLRHMEVPGEPGLYVLGCFERRVTLYSQQVRALNLVYALHHEKRLKPGDAVAVIGGSVAAMTTAAGAARLGYEVTLLEKGGVLLPLLRGNRSRWVYPHLYDWPEPESEQRDAGLPLLDWTAALAQEVADQLDTAWKGLAQRACIKVHTGVSSIDVHPGASRLVTWNKRGPQRGKFAAVIFAVGFGLERRMKDTPWVSYWQNDALHQPSLEGRRRHLISGCGDGGLIDLLRVCVRDFRHEHLIDQFLTRVPAATRERLLAIDDEAGRVRDPGEYLDEQYRALDVPQEVDDAFGELREDTTAVLNGLDASPFNLGASILNRFLVSRLLFRFGVDYRVGKITSRRVKGRYEVTFPTGDPEMFDHVTCRHGTGPAALESFRDVWSKCGPLRDRNALDQTRWPIYGDAFGPGTSGGAPPPASAGKPHVADASGAREAPFLGVRSDSLGDGFKGRDQDLALLHNALLGAGSVALRSHPGHVYAHGGGGLGKSRLAIEYAWRRRDDYPGGVFFAVVTTRTPLAVLAGFGRELFAGEDLTRDDDAARHFATWLADPSPGRRLLVLDDVQGSQEEVTTRFKERVDVRGQVIWPLGGLGHVTVLMTTRLRDLPGARPFEVRQLDARGALALLLDKAGKKKLVRAEKAAAKELADKVLGGHPLALSLAGAYVRRARLSFAEYRRLLLDAKGVVLKLEEAARHVGNTIDDHEASIAATYSLSREQLAPTDPLDALGLRILSIAACVAPSVPIDRGLLRRMLRVEGDAAEPAAVGLAESRLLDLALLDADRKGWGEGDVAIHPLVADYTLSVLDEQERERVQQAMLQGLGELFPDHSHEYWRITQPNADSGWEWLTPAREAHAQAAWVRTEPVMVCERSTLSASLGDLHFARGDAVRALAAYRSALALDARMVEQTAGNARWEWRLSTSHSRIGDVLHTNGNLAGAIISYRASLAIREPLALQEPHNVGVQSGVSVSYSRIGNILLAQGNSASALDAYRATLAINERLANQDPENTGWRRNLSISHEKIGDALFARGDSAGALDSYRRSFAIRERLVQQEPGNALWQCDISVSHNKFSEVLFVQDDRAGALTSCRAALSIAERLALQDSGNAGWQTNFAGLCHNLGLALSGGTRAERAEARTLFERALRILRALAAASRLAHEQQHKWLPALEAALNALPL